MHPVWSENCSRTDRIKLIRKIGQTVNKPFMFENAPGVNPQDLLTAVLCFVDKGENLRALSSLMLLEELEVEDFRLVEASIKIYATIGASDQIINTIEKALKTYPDKKEKIYYFGGAALCNNDSNLYVEKAAIYLRQYLKGAPAHVPALCYYLSAVSSLGRPAESAKTIEKIILASDQPDHNYRVRLIELYLLLNQKSRALKHYNIILSNPSDIKMLSKANLKILDDLAIVFNQPTNEIKVPARYPKTRKDISLNLKKAIKKYVLGNILGVEKFIDKETTFFTMGSCFARHIALALRAQKLEVGHLERVETSPIENLLFLKWLMDPKTVEDEQAEWFESTTSAANAGPEVFRHLLANSKVIILTVGVAPSFFEKGTSKFIIPGSTQAGTLIKSEKYEFRTTTVSENVNSLNEATDIIRILNPKAKIFLTLSPVPLVATFEMPSAVQADCLSKSTLRVAINELLNQNIPNMFYWPSFEIVRWLIPHVDSPFGNDDGSNFHVNEQIINMIMDLYVETYSMK